MTVTRNLPHTLAIPFMAEYPTRAEAIASLDPLFRCGLSVRDVAERLRAHPRAVVALMRSRGGGHTP
jgi:hypothetical protein